jgi:hypothetical protein
MLLPAKKKNQNSIILVEMSAMFQHCGVKEREKMKSKRKKAAVLIVVSKKVEEAEEESE